MYFLLMLSVALIPLSVAVIITFMFERTKLVYALSFFLLLASVWQMDVAFLYAYDFFSISTINFIFRFLRFGPILLTPTMFYVAYVAVDEVLYEFRSRIWYFFMNKYTIGLFYIWSFFTYAISWTESGITQLYLYQSDNHSSFLFPEYGSMEWVFQMNVILFVMSIIIGVFMTIKMKKSHTRSFLIAFILTTTIGYIVGILNFFEQNRLFASAIAVVIFAIAVLIAFTLMHTKMVRDMNNALTKQKEFLKTIIDMNPNFIYAKNEKGIVTLANQSFANLYGLQSKDLLGKCEYEYNHNHEEVTKNLQEEHEVLQSFTQKYFNEERLRDFEGNVRWVQTLKIPMQFPDGKQILGVATDITDRKKTEEKIKHMAFHDSLTGLPNRRMFHDHLQIALDNAEKTRTNVGVMFLDIDRFKFINDTLNHNTGDMLLKKVAKRLLYHTQEEGKKYKVYRLSGDEFTFIITDSKEEDIVKFVEKVMHSFKQPISLSDHDLFVTSSVGISMFPKDGHQKETLIKNADLAMYHVKEQGRNNYQFFTDGMNQNFQRKMLVEKELRKALELQEFQLYYQPQINAVNKKIFGVEALLRWNNPELGHISPMEFIPLAEETGLIIPIGEWVLRTACIQLKEWVEKGYPLIKVAVNISMRQFAQTDFVEKVKGILEETGIPPKYLTLEITESIALYDIEQVVIKLRQLEAMGIHISMDDFGTGYSSLSYLKKLPIHSLKIDRSFIKEIERYNHESEAIVSMIISMAQHLHLEVIAEGVETQEQLDFLIENNCQAIQGYYFSPPKPPEVIENEYISKLTNLKKQMII